MTEKALREITGPEAEAYADTIGCLEDIKEAPRYAHTILDRWPEGADVPSDPILIALWKAALVAYVRAFGTGVRRYDAMTMFANLPREARDSHDYFTDLRDKHIAHSVNPLEQVRPGIFVGEAPDYAVEGRGYLYMSLLLEQRATVQVFDDLASSVGMLVQADCQALGIRVAEVAAALSPTERAALPNARATAPDLPARRKSRRPRR